MIKLPYALSLLDGKKADDPEFSEKFTFDPAAADEKSTEGSGVIKNVSEKTEYTYLELFTYMLKYSDNVAFAAIREKYGYTPLVSWCSGHKVKGMLKNGLSNQTASDGAVILEALYDFTENNEEFGGLVKDALLNSTHSVVIPYGVYPKKVVHKYGWADEAYHDMGIVLGEHPYILVVMTDLHQGGKEVDAFLQKIVRMIDDFHNNFYKNP